MVLLVTGDTILFPSLHGRKSAKTISFVIINLFFVSKTLTKKHLKKSPFSYIISLLQIEMILIVIFICKPLVPPCPTGVIFKFDYERLKEPAVTQRVGFFGSTQIILRNGSTEARIPKRGNQRQ